MSEPFREYFAEWMRGEFPLSESTAASSIIAFRNQVHNHRVSRPADYVRDTRGNRAARKQIARFHDATVEVRVADEVSDPQWTRLNQRRTVMCLGTEAIGGLWSLLAPGKHDIPEPIRGGATVIINAFTASETTQVAITTPDVPEQDHPEHRYIHVNPGTLLKAQQSYPIADQLTIEVKPPFYAELLGKEVTADRLLAGVVDMTSSLLYQTNLVSQAGSNDFVVEPPVKIDSLRV